MASSFPGAVDSFTTKVDGVDDVMAAHVNDLQNSIIAIESVASGYIITPSVATNDLTVALKTLAATDASATNPIGVRIGNTFRSVTAALSVTALDGTNWFNSGIPMAALEVDYFVYLIQETGASAGTKIGFARVPYARTMSDFVNTTTSEKYIKGSHTNFNATDEVTLIGRFAAILSAVGTHNWSLPATASTINYPIFNTRWLTYTPLVSSSTGTITTVGTVAGSYQVDFNKLFFNHSGTITTNGTGAGGLRITLPFTPVTDNSVCAGRENLVTGNMLQGRAASNYMEYFTYNNVYPGGDGRQIIGGGIPLKLI